MQYSELNIIIINVLFLGSLEKINTRIKLNKLKVDKINSEVFFRSNIIWYASTPVSYTHLDVYKRQHFIQQ